MESSNEPRPLFIYGTLCAKPLLAWALTGDSSNVAQIHHMLRPACVHGYRRFAVKHADYPAVISSSNGSDFVDGYLLQAETPSQRRKLDDFEGEQYKVISVVVALVRHDDQDAEETITADMYLWDDDTDLLSSEPWELEIFVKDRLEDWIDIFDGMELIGEHDK